MKYLIIGGNILDNKNNKIEKVLKEINNPKILYCALATNNYSYNYNIFKNKIDLDIDLLTIDDLINNNYKDKFNKANILYFSGGSANLLMDLIIKYNLEPLITAKNILMIAGVSAGAIMISKYGMGDKDVFLDNGSYYNFKMVEGLGLLNITFCPHYQKEELVIFDEICKSYNLDAYALEDDTAILFNDDKIEKIIKNNLEKACYSLKKADNYLLSPLYERNL